EGSAVLPSNAQSVSHVTLELGYADLVMHMVYPVSPGFCLPPAISIAPIEIPTIDSEGSLPTIPVGKPSFKRFSDKPLWRTAGFIHAALTPSLLCLTHEFATCAFIAKHSMRGSYPR